MHNPCSARFPLIFTLLFALLVVQMGSLAHGIAHILVEPSHGSKQSLPHDKYCKQCAAHVQIGSAVGSSAINFLLDENCRTLKFNHLSSRTVETFVLFTARAPPFSA